MRLHFLVEGPSEENFLRRLLPRLLRGHRWEIHPHEGKGQLPRDPAAPPSPARRGVLDQLPAKLRAWSKDFNQASDRVVVLVDIDTQGCAMLLSDINALREQMDTPEYLVRFAIEEVEAWYLGDWDALRRAFPKAKKSIYLTYKQDTICGTWEKFQEVIGDPLERKVAWAETMGAALDLEGRNRSESFARFCKGVRKLAGEPDSPDLVRTRKDEAKLRRKAVKHRSR